MAVLRLKEWSAARQPQTEKINRSVVEGLWSTPAVVVYWFIGDGAERCHHSGHQCFHERIQVYDLPSLMTSWCWKNKQLASDKVSYIKDQCLLRILIQKSL